MNFINNYIEKVITIVKCIRVFIFLSSLPDLALEDARVDVVDAAETGGGGLLLFEDLQRAFHLHVPRPEPPTRARHAETHTHFYYCSVTPIAYSSFNSTGYNECS